MSATAEIEGTTATDPREEVARPLRDATYVARCHNLIISIFPQLRENVSGMTRDLSPGFRLQFIGHNVTVNPKLRREFEKFLGRYGRLYAYDEQDELEIKGRSLEEYIEAHPAFNTSNPDGFYRQALQVPAASGEIRDILDAFMEGDEERIEELLEAEVADHARPEVIEAANKALERIHLDRAREAVLGAASGPESGAVGPQAPDADTAGPDDP